MIDDNDNSNNNDDDDEYDRFASALGLFR